MLSKIDVSLNREMSGISLGRLSSYITVYIICIIMIYHAHYSCLSWDCWWICYPSRHVISAVKNCENRHRNYSGSSPFISLLPMPVDKLSKIAETVVPAVISSWIMTTLLGLWKTFFGVWDERIINVAAVCTSSCWGCATYLQCGTVATGDQFALSE